MAFNNIMQMFRSNAGNQNQPLHPGHQAAPGYIQNQGQQGNQQATAQPSQAGNGGNNNPSNAVVPGAAPGQTGTVAQGDRGIPKNLDKASLDDFSKIWEQPQSKDGKPVADPSKFTRPKFDASNPKFQEAMGRMDFTAGIDQERVGKALGGDAQAFMEVLNSVARNGFQTALAASDSYQGRILDQYDQSVSARIPKAFGSMESRQAVGQLNPAFQHPSLAPVVESIRNMIEQQYPEASPQEVAQAVNVYFTQAAKTLTASQSESGTSAGNQNGRNNTGQSGRGSHVVSDFENFESIPDQRSQH